VQIPRDLCDGSPLELQVLCDGNPLPWHTSITYPVVCLVRLKICYLIPSGDYMDNAGARIRYRRIENEVRSQGDKLYFLNLQNITENQHLVYDVYIISKCYDIRSIMAARKLKGLGKRVGVDLFDDYFSQYGDNRLLKFRHWITALLDCVDFIICSTPAMQDLVSGMCPGKPVHVMNDPGLPLDPANIRRALLEKLEYARRTQTINIAWFGIGDNPHFSVGLRDLAGFGNALVRLCGRGYTVRLNILTNQRAMTPDNMAMLRRLAIPYSIDAWTVEKESRLLEDNLVCFLPVNAQNFSVVKSLNRAITALSAGVQVISNGYPLYDPLSPLIYNSAEIFFSDLERQQLALRSDTVPDLENMLNVLASPAGEASRLGNFILSLYSEKPVNIALPQSSPAVIDALVHGKETSEILHLFATRTRALSIASPYCKTSYGFDMRFVVDEEKSELSIYIASKITPELNTAAIELLRESLKIHDAEYQRLDLSHLHDTLNLQAVSSQVDSTFNYVASYAAMMELIARVTVLLFPGVNIYNSDMEVYPCQILARLPDAELS